MSFIARLRAIIKNQPLPNTGSVARDLLASERTFLAWTRTGLGFIALGVALEKVEVLATISPLLLQRDEDDEWRTRMAAGVLVGAGTLCVSHGTRRYFTTLEYVKQGLFRPNVGGVVMAAGVSIAIAIAGALLVVEKEDRERVKRISVKADKHGVQASVVTHSS